jgi:hypothetical protein
LRWAGPGRTRLRAHRRSLSDDGWSEQRTARARYRMGSRRMKERSEGQATIGGLTTRERRKGQDSSEECRSRVMTSGSTCWDDRSKRKQGLSREGNEEPSQQRLPTQGSIWFSASVRGLLKGKNLVCHVCFHLINYQSPSSNHTATLEGRRAREPAQFQRRKGNHSRRSNGSFDRISVVYDNPMEGVLRVVIVYGSRRELG